MIYKVVISEWIILTFIVNEHYNRKIAVYIYIQLLHIHSIIILAVSYILQ